MKQNLQIINWNFSYQGYNKGKLDFLFSQLENPVCIMLQEITPDVYDYMVKAFGESYHFVYSLEHRKPGLFDSDARKLGVLIACSKSVKILDSGVIERNLFPDRTAWATIEAFGRQIKLLALHSVTGCGYHKAKSAQYHTFSEFIEEFQPDIIGIDANEPMVDSYDIEQMEFYPNGNGAACFFRRLKANALADAYVRANNITECKTGEYLTPSCLVRGKGAVRYDFLFVKPSLVLNSCRYLYEQSLVAGSDHALITASLSLE